MLAALTFTMHVAVLPPSSVLTVIVAVPIAFAVTTPLDETVATEVLLDDQVIPWLVAFDGWIVALRVTIFPTSKFIVLLSRDIPVTVTGAALTVTVQVAFFAPSDVVHVIVAEPVAMAVIVPSDATEATDILLEVQETSVFVASLGETVGVNLDVWPTVSDNDVGDTDTPVTGTFVITVTAQVAFFPPS